jgi:hypothetical protein
MYIRPGSNPTIFISSQSTALIVLVLIRAPITALRTGGGVLCIGADGPLLGPNGLRFRVGLEFLALWTGQSAPRGRTVRACAWAAEFASGT